MILKDIGKQIAEAMKAHDEVRLATLKLLYSALNYEKIDKQHELTREEELAVVRREAKKRKEAIEAYQKANALGRVEREEKELKILQGYLPPEISDEDLKKLVDEAVAAIKPSGMADMGKIITFVKQKDPGADGGRIAALVGEKL